VQQRQNKKNTDADASVLFLTFSDVRSRQNSGLADCADGALRLAGTAVDAGIRVDLIVGITLLDSVHRALRSAAAAADAGITDYTCHFIYLRIVC
jgi:hypothetical protein